MADNTKIEWTQRPGTIGATMNALVGCQKVSEGCRNCYAISVAHVRAGNPLPVMQEKFGGTTKREGGKTLWTGKVTLSEEALLAPLKAKKPRTYFVNAMSDLFYEGVPDEWIDRHFAVFALCPEHTFIVLTKRPARMREYLDSVEPWNRISCIASAMNTGRDYTFVSAGNGALFLANVWMGVSVEDQKTADERIPLLLQTPAAVRFISAEPLLGAVDLTALDAHAYSRAAGHQPSQDELLEDWRYSCLATGDYYALHADGYKTCGDGNVRETKLDWVICGGESGPGARPMHPDWARSLRDQCVAAVVPFFFKQWGEWHPTTRDANGELAMPHADWSQIPLAALRKPGCAFGRSDEEQLCLRIGKKAAGRLLDGVEWKQFPEVR